MPLYEYHCTDCEAQFEALVPFSQADSITCERCAGHSVERLASTFASTRDVQSAQPGPCGSMACPPSG
jgi:putative FmdB family regulatory protein